MHSEQKIYGLVLFLVIYVENSFWFGMTVVLSKSGSQADIQIEGHVVVALGWWKREYLLGKEMQLGSCIELIGQRVFQPQRRKAEKSKLQKKENLG